MKRQPYFLILLVIALGLQVAFWFQTKRIFPDMSILPDVLSRQSMDVMAMGDDEFAFRAMAFRLNNAGDTFGRSTSLRKYDLEKVYRWFSLLDHYNFESDLLPFLASYYYGQTQKKEQARYMVNYMYEHAKKSPETKWWWIIQAIYLAQHRVEDEALALKVAKPLAHSDKIPVAARQMLAIMYEKSGEMEAAAKIIDDIMNSAEEISEKDLRYMRYFVLERIERMDEMKELFEKRERELKEKSQSATQDKP